MQNRIEDLLAQLTLEEKVSLIAGVDLWHTAAVPRLGVPAIKMTDGPVGARGAGGDSGPASVCFPCGVALAATWNTGLVRQVGEVLALETRAKGASILLAPTVNIHRSPLAGRNFECYSEDPFLSGKMAAAYIQGLQSRGVSACIKHFVCNDSEYQRHSMSSEVPERALREIYLKPFEIALREAEPWALMSAYNKLNGTWCSENTRLLEEILKKEWDFDGLVISDWLGTYSEAAAKGGLDLEMPGPGRWLGQRVLQMVESGEISLAQIDEKVRRLLRLLERLGALDTPPSLDEQASDSPERRALARRAAAESIVLLKNRDQLLPIDPRRVRRIAVIGQNARWAQIVAGGSALVNPQTVISPLDGLRARAGEDVRIDYAPGCYLNRRLPLLETDWLLPDAQGRRGFQVQTFDTLDFSGAPLGSWFSQRSTISWYQGNLSGADPYHFSAVLTAQMSAPENGVYRFGVSGNGRTQLLVDGKVLIDSQAAQGVEIPPDPDEIKIDELSAEILLQAGQTIQLAYRQSWDGATPWVNLRLACLPPRLDEAALLHQAVELARQADLALVFAGYTAEWEGESFDRPHMDLPGLQNTLIEQVAAANPNTVVVLNSGAAVHMPWLEQVSGLLQTWYGGQETGAAITEVLFGDSDACGRLPVTFPRRLQDTPAFLNYPGENGRVYYGEGLFVGYRYYDKKDIQPLFPFGFGLSYTTFEFSDLKLDKSSYRRGETLHASLSVTNTGKRKGRAVVQVYLRDVHASLARPEKELKGFQGLDLEPGETRRVEFVLDADALAFYDDARQAWVSEDGVFELLAGASALDIRQRAVFEWLGGGVHGQAQNAPKLTLDSTLGELLAYPQARLALQQHLGDMLNHPMLEMAKTFSLKQLAAFAPELLTPQLLQSIALALKTA